MQTSIRERLISAVGAVISVILLGYLLLVGLTVEPRVRRGESLQLLDIRMPRPKQDRPRPRIDRQKPRKASGKASPRALRNKAAAIVTAPPLVPQQVPSPVVSAPKPGLGMAASAGASDRPGQGTGSGGRGNGTGGGGYGNGNGNDDDEVPPRLIKGRLKFSDLPSGLRDNGVGGTVSVRYGVEANGRVSDCTVMTSSGSAELDQLTCQLIQQRFRFDPSRDHEGHPVRSFVEESHTWIIEQNREALPQP